LDLDSNSFLNNHAKNGGAIYFANDIQSNENDEYISNINFNNNKFINNSAQNFGGGIYSEFYRLHLSQSKDNEIIYNSAGILGGGCFSPKNKDVNMFDINNWNIENNTVNSVINNYSSKPSYITLNTTTTENNNIINISSGNNISLNFTLYDEYDNILSDVSQYFPISIKLELEIDNNNKNDDNDILYDTEINSNHKVYSNIGTFIKGNNNNK